MLETIANIFQYILDLGPSVFVPIIMLTIGLVARMKFKDAFSAALIFGVAFAGINLVVDFMLDNITPAAQAFAKNTGINLTAVDGGWTTGASITWAWRYSFIAFPITIIINLIMLILNWTKTLNVDMWNVWGKAFAAVMVTYISGNIYLAFIVVAIQVVVELKVGDLWAKEIEELTGIPGVTLPHHMTLIACLLYPIDKLMDKIPIFNKQMDVAALKEKIGIFSENHVMGFIVGTILGLIGGYTIAEALILGVNAAAALTLFPMVSKLFMQALSPISDAISEFMKSKFKDRELYIGLDWPILAGSNEIWVLAILLIPFELLFAVILPGNEVLPFAGLINLSIIVAAYLLGRGNILRMLGYGIITTPVFLYIGTYFSPYITRLAQDTGAINVSEGTMLGWATIENGEFKFAFANAMAGHWWGILLAVVWIGLFIIFYRGRSKEDAKRYAETD
ncbi:PTS galactitol transporter subunit IIC [Tetragenococcus halophilus subsp. flandriensis]|uniref:PTS galactitol transporter subunit IIC n=1 Tax=Tetragenococcus halophilus TaxID=51669 RepID=UPI0023E9DDE9|nr:PTS transporter subunit IIC [Tetragenococcus halophilus]GMA08750.1 PTS galactitol transporter subunit IIC [Tetragenococcus halophilus subsp. flandriensis]